MTYSSTINRSWQFQSSGIRATAPDSESADLMVECAHALVAAQKMHFARIQPVMPHHCHAWTPPVFKRPGVARGAAFQPVAPAVRPPRESQKLPYDHDFLPCPIPKRQKRNDSVESLPSLSPLFVEPADDELFVETKHHEESIQLPGSESSLLSPPLSPKTVSTDTMGINQSRFTALPQKPLSNTEVPYRQPVRGSLPVASNESNSSMAGSRLPTPKRSTIQGAVPVRPHTPAPIAIMVEQSRECISCHIKQTPCWRPSWDPKRGQLCNSCGLRFRKTRIRCSDSVCMNVPSKLDLAAIRARCTSRILACPKCDSPLVRD